MQRYSHIHSARSTRRSGRICEHRVSSACCVNRWRTDRNCGSCTCRSLLDRLWYRRRMRIWRCICRNNLAGRRLAMTFGRQLVLFHGFVYLTRFRFNPSVWEKSYVTQAPVAPVGSVWTPARPGRERRIYLLRQARLIGKWRIVIPL